MMTLSEFRAGRQWCDDLGAALGDADLEHVAGFLYGPKRGHYIDEAQEEYRAMLGGRWHLILERSEWCSDDLESLEERLYEWVTGEYGWVELNSDAMDLWLSFRTNGCGPSALRS